MRAKDFFLYAQTDVVYGASSNFDVTGSSAEITSNDVVFQSSMINSDYNTFISDRTVSNGSVSVQFSKSATSGSNDSIDTFIFAARG